MSTADRPEQPDESPIGFTAAGSSGDWDVAVDQTTGSPARGHVPGATAIGTAFGAIESLTENLAIEVGPAGVRVVCLRTTANIDSRTIQKTMEAVAKDMHITKEQALASMADLNFLKRPATVADTAKAAVLLASDGAGMMTGTVVNATAGAALD